MENSSELYILDSNESSRAILESYLKEINPEFEIKSYGDFSVAVEDIKKTEKSMLVFVDISDCNDFIENIVEQIKLHTGKIVITSNNYSTDIIIKAMRMGAKEFLPKPVLKDDLDRVVENLYDNSVDDVPASKIITIYSNKGGIGKTTLATNLAYELAQITRDKVALIDLNLQLGDVSTFLNLNPFFDAAYVIKNLTEKKEDVLLKAFERYEDLNLYVLSDPNYIEQSESITPQQIEKLFESLKKVFPYIIVDMSSNIDPNSLKILDKSDLILFTTIVNIPAIRNAQRCLNLFRSRRYPLDRVKIIINRFMENDDIKIEDIETALGEKVYWKIPNNYFSIMESINKGVPVNKINANSNIASSFRDLALKISDEIIEQALSKHRRS